MDEYESMFIGKSSIAPVHIIGLSVEEKRFLAEAESGKDGALQPTVRQVHLFPPKRLTHFDRQVFH